MPQSPDAPVENQIPLVVDLDGTLIKTDLLWESLARLLRRNPFWLFPVLFWWICGRAVLKRKIANRVTIDPAILPYNEKFLAFLREQKSGGRKIILATASDKKLVLPVANHVGLFDDVFASDGQTNLRSKNKLKKLVEQFGECGFDYAGNSLADLAVWRGSREGIVVNASRIVLKRAGACVKIAATFRDNYSRFAILKSFLNEIFIRSGYLGAIVAGLLLTAAFPKIGIAGLVWIAPALIYFFARDKNSGDAFRVGCVAGLSFWLASLYWLLLIPVAGFPILGWLVLGAFLSLFFGAWTFLISDFGFRISTSSWVRRTFWSLAGAAIWVALEMIRARIFTGFPWNLLGDSQYKMISLIQIASITGVYGISFLVVWISLSLFSAARMFLSKPASRFAWLSEIFVPLLAIAAIFAFGFMKLREPVPANSILRVTLIQPSVPQTLIWNENENSNRFEQLLRLSENALTNKTDLLVWPESALPEFNDASYAAIKNLVRAHRVWMIFNADDIQQRADGGVDYFNAAFFFDPDGDFVNVYHKRRLVVFGEYIPLVRWLPFVKWFTPITGSYASGEKPVTFEINLHRWGENLPSLDQKQIDLNGVPPRQTIRTSPLICFEDAFPQLARESAKGGVDFLVNLTNDGWFGNSAEQWQHMAMATFRAVENGVPLVRCCNNGVTCWIDSHGRVRKIFRDATGSVYGMGAMTIALPLPYKKPAPTFYNRHGDWFGWSCVTISFLLLTIKIARRL
ncbi:MAG: apolipoprotein N-acyltransferase [Limisphaerales bacterium]